MLSSYERRSMYEYGVNIYKSKLKRSVIEETRRSTSMQPQVTPRLNSIHTGSSTHSVLCRSFHWHTKYNQCSRYRHTGHRR